MLGIEAGIETQLEVVQDQKEKLQQIVGQSQKFRAKEEEIDQTLQMVGVCLFNPKLEKKIGQFKMFFATNVLNKNGSILEKLQKNHQVVSLEVQTQAPVLLRD